MVRIFVRMIPFMPKTRSAVISPDGFLDLPENPSLEHNDEFGAPALRGHMVVQGFQHGPDLAYARQLHERNLLQAIGKSGGSRVGIHVMARTDEPSDFNLEKGRVVVPVNVLSLRAVQMRQNGVQDDLLRVLADMATERDVPIGRLLLADPKDALSHDQVMEAIRNHQLALSPLLNAAECVDEQGCISLPLENLHFAFCEANFRTEQMRRVIRYGKHGLGDLQAMERGVPQDIEEKGFFVGGIRLSIGPFIAVIDEATNTPGVVHLAARVLDGIRTTGLDVVRQVELFNKLYDAVTTEGLRIRIRLHHANRDMQKFAKNVISPRTIVHGVSLSDVINIAGRPELIHRMMSGISPSVADGNPAGYFIGPGRAHKVKWVDHPRRDFQNSQLAITAPKFAAGDADYCVTGHEMPQPAEDLAKRLGYVGGDQNHSKMYIARGFPSTDTMHDMLQSGIGVFVGSTIRQTDDIFVASPKVEGAAPNNAIFFTDREFAAFQNLHRDGAHFLLARDACPDAFAEMKTLPACVLEWHQRGMWVHPEHKERLEKVDTLIAMYGSHTKGMDAVLRSQITRFELRMKRLFGEHLAFIHGKGPGVMHIADTVARHLPELAKEHEGFEDITEGAVSIGVGIDLEQQNQALNHHPHAQIDFGSQHRLVRQKHMNDRAVFNIFNLGGAGTLEEVALTLCSQKLYKNILTPMMFVDPAGVSNGGGNFWLKLQEFIRDMATNKQITLDEGAEGTANIQLLQAHMPNFIHVVDSYDAAADILERFVADPVAYYLRSGVTQQEFQMAYSGAIEVRKDTKFPMPFWMDGQEFGRMSEDPRWNVTVGSA